MHDNNGNPLTKLPLCVPDQPPGSVPIIGLDWYHGLEGYADPNAPTLALAFENGKIQVGNHIDFTIFSDENLISLSSHRDVCPSVSWISRRVHRLKRAHACICLENGKILVATKNGFKVFLDKLLVSPLPISPPGSVPFVGSTVPRFERVLAGHGAWSS